MEQPVSQDEDILENDEGYYENEDYDLDDEMDDNEGERKITTEETSDFVACISAAVLGTAEKPHKSSLLYKTDDDSIQSTLDGGGSWYPYLGMYSFRVQTESTDVEVNFQLGGFPYCCGYATLLGIEIPDEDFHDKVKEILLEFAELLAECAGYGSVLISTPKDEVGISFLSKNGWLHVHSPEGDDSLVLMQKGL